MSRGSSSLCVSGGVPFGSYAESDDFLNYFLFLEVGCLLHGDLAEGIDVHSGIGQVDCIVLDLYLPNPPTTF